MTIKALITPITEDAAPRTETLRNYAFVLV